MWVMPTSEFLRLPELRPHEELRSEGKIVELDPSHRTVFYISHQWTSANHPDNSTTQLRALQTILLRMRRCELPETAPTFADAIRFPSDVKIGRKEWRSLVNDAFIWMDYLSVRRFCVSTIIGCALNTHCAAHSQQIPQSNQVSVKGELSDREKATRSISAYIERCSHFFALCPHVRSRDQKDVGVEYDYGSWLASAACRMELFALLLARKNSIPAIVSPRLGRRKHVAHCKKCSWDLNESSPLLCCASGWRLWCL